MCVWRFILLLLTVFQVTVVVADYRGDEAAACSLSENSAPVWRWSPYQNVYNPFVKYGSQRNESKPRSTNPWLLPVPQDVPSFPRYFDSGSKTDNSVNNTYSGSFVMSEPDLNTVESPENQAGALPVYQYQQPAGSAVDINAGNGFGYRAAPRFVTPDVLDSLKQQQMQTQQTYPFRNERRYSGNDWQSGQRQRNSSQYAPSQSYGGADSYWAQPDMLKNERLLYKGDSLPMVPDAAVSGLPPMTIFEPLPPGMINPQTGYPGQYGRFGFGPYGDFIQ